MKSNKDAIGGHWLPNLMIWGGVLLMLTGGVFAYPTLQGYLAAPDAQSLEFSVTQIPPPTVAAVAIGPTLQSEPDQQDSVEPTPQATLPGTVEATPQATPPDPSAVQDEAVTETAPPPVVLPETELMVVQETPTVPEVQVEEPATPEATPEPTLTPSPTPTPDPASLIPGRLLIPVIGLDAPVVVVGWDTKEVNGQLVSNWIVPDAFAAGWHTTSALPGNPGNTVLNGHHNIHGEVFRNLEDLQAGDEIVIHTGRTVHYYSVTERHVLEEKNQPPEVREKNAQFVLPTEDERLTLVTCWPYTNNTHRLIIVALPVEPTPLAIPKAQ